MPNKIAKNTSDVPKSGCFITRMNGKPTYKNTGKISLKVLSLPILFSSNAANDIIIIIFENSDGCKVIGPI